MIRELIGTFKTRNMMSVLNTEVFDVSQTV